MNEYGKNEKKPEEISDKQVKLKSTLLQTYFASLLCLVLCVTMFLGTTYAWFTSEVKSTDNEIYIGILDVDLQMNGASLGESDTKVFDNTIRWEPGYTALRSLTVLNEGDLAFNYTLSFTDGAAKDAQNNETNLDAVANHFAVWVYSGSYSKTESESFADMTAKEGWMNVGTLAEVLNGKAVFSGSMTKDDVVDANGARKETAHTYTVALHMNESAENTTNENGKNSLMGKSVRLNVKLTAYQMGSEQDAFGAQYDRMVATTDELKAALEKGGTVALAADVDLGDEQITIPAGVTATLDMNGKNLTGSYMGSDHYAMFTIPDGASLTINGNGNIRADTKAAKSNLSLALFQNSGELTLNGGTYNVNDSTEGQTWIIATIVDNRTKSASCAAKLTINGGDYSVSGKAINLFRNYPQQGGTATVIVNNGTFHDNEGATTYFWNQEAGSYVGELYFNGGTYDAGVVYEDYNGQSDIHIADGVTIRGYSGNN